MPEDVVGEQAPAAADGVVLGGGSVVEGGTEVVVGGIVVGGAVVVGGTVEVVLVTTALAVVEVVALVDDEHAAAPMAKATIAITATRLIIPPPLSMLSAAR